MKQQRRETRRELRSLTTTYTALIREGEANLDCRVPNDVRHLSQYVSREIGRQVHMVALEA